MGVINSSRNRLFCNELRTWSRGYPGELKSFEKSNSFEFHAKLICDWRAAISSLDILRGICDRFAVNTALLSKNQLK